MDDTLSRWLQLREPADAVARSATLTRAITDTTAEDEPVHVLDLATGTGSNLRYLATHLPGRQRWLVVDRNSTLLAQVPALTSAWGAARHLECRTDVNRCVIRGRRLECDLECDVETRSLDLGALADVGIFAGRHLVTASALLDLASERWLRELAARCRAAGAAALFALTYNGRSSCSPAEPEDEMIRDLLNRHQKTDKGLGGPAAGPDAAACTLGCFREVGYRVRSAPSDWVLGSGERELQRRLIEGWTAAATEMAPGDASAITRWRMRRLGHIDADRSRVVVGHVDVAAWLPRGGGSRAREGGSRESR